MDELFIVKRYLVKVTKDKYLKRLLQLKKSFDLNLLSKVFQDQNPVLDLGINAVIHIQVCRPI